MSTSIKKTSSKKTTTKKSNNERFKPFSLTIKTIVAFFTFVIVVVYLFYYLNDIMGDFTRPDYKPIATVYHSEMIGVDEGNEYVYSIFENKSMKNGKYFYIKSKARVTVVGAEDNKDVSSGSINFKSDLNKISKDIDHDFMNDTTKNVSYRYLVNGEYVNVDTIEELGNKLFS